jgi:hypothetical protein
VRINLTPEARQAECSALETARQDNLPNTGLEAHACGTPVRGGGSFMSRCCEAAFGMAPEHHRYAERSAGLGR